ncbi:MAG TPA: GAP family protein [Candidatus Saccharimonadales bacterium]|jgi:cytochrome c biogenesis protein CcdA
MLIISLIAIALVDSLNPSIILMTLYLLSTEKPMRRTASYISAVFLTNWALGSLAFFGLGAVFSILLDRILSTTAWWVYALQFVAAILLLYFAFSMKNTQDASLKKKPRAINPKATFALGIGTTFLEFSTAAPYLAAIATLTRADVSAVYAVTSLAMYNIFYMIIPLVFVAVYIFKREQAAEILVRISKRLSRIIRKSAKVLFFVLGIILLLDFVGYLFGRPFLVF